MSECPYCTSSDTYIGSAHEVDAHCNSCGHTWCENARLREQVAHLREALSTVRAYIREADAFVVHIDRTAKTALEATEDSDE